MGAFLFLLLGVLLTFGSVFGIEKCKLTFNGYSGTLGLLECQNLVQNSTYRIEVQKGNYTRSFYSYHPLKEDYLPFAIPCYWNGNLTLSLFREGLKLAKVTLEVLPHSTRNSYIRLKGVSSFKGKKGEKPTLSRKEAYSFLRKVLRIYTPVRYYEAKAIFPLKVYKRISSPFGVRRYINGRFVGFHKGVDISAPLGTPVYSTLSGRVVLARYLPLTGNTVVVDHGWGLMSLYAHLSEIDVKEGKFVKQGQIIGKVGSSGRSTGPHLHFGVYLNDVAVDPLQFLKLKLKPAFGGD